MKTLRWLVVAAAVVGLASASTAFAQRTVATFGKEAMDNVGHLQIDRCLFGPITRISPPNGVEYSDKHRDRR